MSKELLLYILSFIARTIILLVIWRKYGLKAWGWTLMYTLLTVISEVPEVV